MAKASKSYQEMNDDLAELMAWFEGDQVDLDEAVAKYDQAMRLLAEMEVYLNSVENRIKKIARGPR